MGALAEQLASASSDDRIEVTKVTVKDTLGLAYKLKISEKCYVHKNGGITVSSASAESANCVLCVVHYSLEWYRKHVIADTIETTAYSLTRWYICVTFGVLITSSRT